MAKQNPTVSKTPAPARANRRPDQDEPTAAEIAAGLSAEDLGKLREVLALADAAPAPVDEGPLVRVYHLNRSKGSFLHGVHRLDPGGSANVPQSVADLWLGHTDGTGKPHVALSEAPASAADPAHEAEKARLSKELEASKGESDSLKARVEGLERLLAAAQKENGGDGGLPPKLPATTPPID